MDWMSSAAIAFGVLAFLWVLASMKTSRPDGRMLKVHPFRRMMTFIMQGRNESVVYFDDYIEVEKLHAYIADARERFPVDITHCTVAGVALGLATAPKMNRFVVGHRLYERNGRWITFSMKRRKMDREAKLAAVKLEMPDGQTFRELAERINGKVVIERSDRKTSFDIEMNLLSALPRGVLRFAVRLWRLADYYNLLPGLLIRTDAMYTSVFVANLGSLRMGAGYHHLYEWGSCPLFLMIGQIEDRPVVRNGEVVVRPMMHVRFSYDERIDDGLNARFGIDTLRTVLEDPYTYLGCLREDGSDARPLSEPVAEVYASPEDAARNAA